VYSASAFISIHLLPFDMSRNLTRRNFIAASSGLSLASGATSSALAETAPAKAKEKPNPIAIAAKKPIPQIAPLDPVPGLPAIYAGPMLGHVTHNEAWLWIRATQDATWKVLVSEDAMFDHAMTFQGGAVNENAAHTSAVRLHGLKPATRYHYQVLLNDRVVSPLPEPIFMTAPEAEHQGRLRVAFSSCVGRLPVDSSAAFGEMADRLDFDLLFMLGDNHYGDTTDLERQRLYYTAHRQIAGFRELGARKPVYAIWDDHDYGPNDSDSTADGKIKSLQAFREFWANAPREANKDDQAIYYSFVRSGVEFFMLDVRWHRSPNRAPDGPDKTMLGRQQLEWLKQGLKTSKAKIKILASGSEWQTNGHKDSWTSFNTERSALFDWLEEEGIEGVVLLSGDRHFSAGYHVRSRWPEFTAGPLGSPNERNAKAAVSAETFTVRYDGKMWMILDIDTSPETPQVSYEIWEAGEGMIESRVLPVEVVKGLPYEMERSPLVKDILAQRGL